MDLDWTVEEAEVAVREQIMWMRFSNQAVSAVMHNADQYISISFLSYLKQYCIIFICFSLVLISFKTIATFETNTFFSVSF